MYGSMVSLISNNLFMVQKMTTKIKIASIMISQHDSFRFDKFSSYIVLNLYKAASTFSNSEPSEAQALDKHYIDIDGTYTDARTHIQRAFCHLQLSKIIIPGIARRCYQQCSLIFNQL